MLRGFWVGVALLVVGCGGAADDADDGSQSGTCPAPVTTSEPKPDPVCEAGRAAECPCPDGTKSAQECASDGSAWLECACEEKSDPASSPTATPSTPPDTGTKYCFSLPAQEQVDKLGGCPEKFPYARSECYPSTVDAGFCYAISSFFCCSV